MSEEKSRNLANIFLDPRPKIRTVSKKAEINALALLLQQLIVPSEKKPVEYIEQVNLVSYSYTMI